MAAKPLISPGALIEIEEKANTARLNWFIQNYDLLNARTKSNVLSRAAELQQEIREIRCARIQRERRLANRANVEPVAVEVNQRRTSTSQSEPKTPDDGAEVKKKRGANVKMESNQAVKPEPNVPEARNVFPEILEPEVGPKMTMKPIPEAVRNILYDGISRNGEGRKLYLETRYGPLAPEDRYYFPETTSFLYGWQVEKLAPMLKNTKGHGNVAVIQGSFYSTTHVDPDRERTKQPLDGFCNMASL